MTDYCLISGHTAELVHAQGIQEKHEILQAEDRIQCQNGLQYAKLGEMYCFVQEFLRRLSDEVQAQVHDRVFDKFHLQTTPCNFARIQRECEHFEEITQMF